MKQKCGRTGTKSLCTPPSSRRKAQSEGTANWPQKQELLRWSSPSPTPQGHLFLVTLVPIKQPDIYTGPNLYEAARVTAPSFLNVRAAAEARTESLGILESQAGTSLTFPSPSKEHIHFLEVCDKDPFTSQRAQNEPWQHAHFC